MPFYLLELHANLLKHGANGEPSPGQEGWRMFARCWEDDWTTCDLLFSDPADFSVRTKKDFFSFLTYLFEAGKAGVPWRDLFKDGKVFHPVHRVTVERAGSGGKRRTETLDVFQFKKARTDIRILFVQSGLGQLHIFISHAFEKSTPKTPAAEQARAEANVNAFFRALDAGDLQLISSQGGKDDTPSFK